MRSTSRLDANCREGLAPDKGAELAAVSGSSTWSERGVGCAAGAVRPVAMLTELCEDALAPFGCRSLGGAVVAIDFAGRGPLPDSPVTLSGRGIAAPAAKGRRCLGFAEAAAACWLNDEAEMLLLLDRRLGGRLVLTRGARERVVVDLSKAPSAVLTSLAGRWRQNSM